MAADSSEFFFIDSLKNITKLSQEKETKMLIEKSHLFIKNQDKPNLNIEPFADLIINDKYLVSDAQIYYLNDNKPLMNGILDMEDLAKIEDLDVNQKLSKTFANGPFRFKGSEQLVVIYHVGQESMF